VPRPPDPPPVWGHATPYAPPAWGHATPYAPPPWGHATPYAPPAWGTGQPYPPYPPRPKPTDGVAIAALVTGALGIWPAAIVCGFVGIRRTRRFAPLQGRGFAIAGTILGFLGLLGTAVLVTVLVVVAHTQNARDTVALLRGDRIRTADLKRGDCFQTPQDLTFGIFSTVAKQDCTSSHSTEAIARSSLYADGPYPGQDVLRTRSDSDCSEALSEVQHQHPDAARVVLLQMVPSRRAWESGHATVICAVLDPTGPRIAKLTDFPPGLFDSKT
jgi:Septum formation/Domain of unknown function (DUF4190)